jgi:hypothetical protein
MKLSLMLILNDIMSPTRKCGITTHSTGRAISWPLIENLRGFGGLCALVNSGVGRFVLRFKKVVNLIWLIKLKILIRPNCLSCN